MEILATFSLLATLMQLWGFLERLVVLLFNIHEWLCLRTTIINKIPLIEQEIQACNHLMKWFSDNRPSLPPAQADMVEKAQKATQQNLIDARALISHQQNPRNKVYNYFRWFFFDRLRCRDAIASFQGANLTEAVMHLMMME